MVDVHATRPVLAEPLITLEREIETGMMAREDDPGTGLRRLFPQAGLRLTGHSRTPYLVCDCSAALKGLKSEVAARGKVGHGNQEYFGILNPRSSNLLFCDCSATLKGVCLVLPSVVVPGALR